jgi:hypothetical protein
MIFSPPRITHLAGAAQVCEPLTYVRAMRAATISTRCRSVALVAVVDPKPCGAAAVLVKMCVPCPSPYKKSPKITAEEVREEKV